MFGIVIGIIVLLLTFLRYRGPKWKRMNFLLSSVISIGVIIICINPDAINFARDILSMQRYQYGRILALLIMTNLFLLIFSILMKSGQENIRIQLDKLVRNLSADTLKDENGVSSAIKPIMVLIPAYNESNNLQELLPNIPDHSNGMDIGVLIIDDGSDDNTAAIARQYDCLAASNLINRGGGAALRLGYDILKDTDCKICVTMDADGQHKPEEIQNLVKPILDDQFDFVIGSRILGSREKDSAHRILGVYMFGILISLLLGKKVTDPSSGFRAFRMDALHAIKLFEDQYHTSELIIESVKKGLRICEVPIEILRRKHGKSKKGRDWIYGFHFARIIVQTWWRPK